MKAFKKIALTAVVALTAGFAGNAFAGPELKPVNSLDIHAVLSEEANYEICVRAAKEEYKGCVVRAFFSPTANEGYLACKVIYHEDLMACGLPAIDE